MVNKYCLTLKKYLMLTKRGKSMDNYHKIFDFVEKELATDNSGHGIQHAKRVFNNAKKIIAKEGGNQKVILTSALIHDTIDRKLFEDVEQRIKIVENFLNKNKYNEDEIGEIIFIISSISWNNGENKKLETLNAQIVRDADRLDAIGAVGIIRTIEYGNSKQRKFYDEENLKSNNNCYEFNKISNSTLSHFYEKLLLLKDRLHTKTAKSIAEERHTLMINFLDEFYKEL